MLLVPMAVHGQRGHKGGCWVINKIGTIEI
jgi:hypothetical protein